MVGIYRAVRPHMVYPNSPTSKLRHIHCMLRIYTLPQPNLIEGLFLDCSFHYGSDLPYCTTPYGLLQLSHLQIDTTTPYAIGLHFSETYLFQDCFIIPSTCH